MTDSSRQYEIGKTHGNSIAATRDSVAVEEPLEIQVSAASASGAAAKSVSITMRTPGNDDELAVGFLFTEGIITEPGQVVSVEPVGPVDEATGLRNTVRVTLDDSVPVDLDRLQRHFYTTSSCGVCGKASLDALRVAGHASLEGLGQAIPRSTLVGLSDAVRSKQAVFDQTGGLHAAAIFSPDGEIVIVREDVGRHNATDKAIGALFLNGHLPGHNYGLFVSGRASFELMQKALVAGITTLAAVGAPSSLAVDTARDYGMTLVGFLRDGGFNLYSGAQRIGD